MMYPPNPAKHIVYVLPFGESRVGGIATQVRGEAGEVRNSTLEPLAGASFKAPRPKLRGWDVPTLLLN